MHFHASPQVSLDPLLVRLGWGKRLKATIAVLAALLVAFAGGVHAETIEWNFDTQDPSSSAIANLNQPQVSQYNNNGTTALLMSSAVSSGYAGASGGSNATLAARIGGLSTAPGGSAAFEFTLQPAAGYRVGISGISFGVRSTSTGPLAYVIRSSADNYTNNLASGSLLNDSVWVFKSHTGLSITPAGSITFRIFGYNGAGPAVAGQPNFRIDDLKLDLAVAPLGDFTYTTSAGTATITGYTGLGGAVTIPATLGGLPVGAIADYAFYDEDLITSVSIPTSVASIGYAAFRFSDSLASVSIAGTGNTTIAPDAFGSCSALATVTLGSRVTSIGNGAFYATSLTGVVIPSSVTSLGTYVFSECPALASVTIPSSIGLIPDGTFYNCDALASVTIPAGITAIREFAFYDCDALTSLSVPTSVTAIGYAAFRFSDSLASVSIAGTGNTTIASDAFGSCSALATVTLGSRVTSIGNGAFYATALTGIVIPSSVTSLGTYVFSECPALASATIPSSIGLIPEGCFYNCDALASVTIPAGITAIHDFAFYDCGALTSITIPSSVTSIGYAAFSYCGSLTNVSIAGTGSTTIDAEAFGRCPALTTVTLGSRVTSIGSYAFISCASLTGIVIPSSVTYLGEGAFSGCASLTGVVIPSSVTSLGDGAFSNCSALASVVIPSSIGVIPESAFNSCHALTGVTIPAGITAIHDFAFYDCGALTSTAIPSSVTSIGYAAFLYCGSLTNVSIAGTGSTTIDAEAFGRCPALTTVTLGSRVTSIGSYAFISCTSLTGIVIPSSVTYLGEGAFSGCAALASVTIPSSIGVIPEGCFNECDALTSVTIQAGITAIHDYAFYDCDALTSITIPASVTSIGYAAFRYSDTLGSAIFLGNAPSLGGDTFANAASGFKVSFYNGATGFTTPTWQGYPSVNLSVTPAAPVITTQPAGITINSGSTATLSVSATGNPAPNYQWYRGSSGVTTNPVGTNSGSFTTPALTTTTSYWVRASNSQGAANSQTATVTVTPLPDLVVVVSAPATAMAGVPFDYTITFRNVGNATAVPPAEFNDLPVYFFPPDGLTFVSASSSDPNVRSEFAGAEVAFFRSGNFAAGASVTLTVRVVTSVAGSYQTYQDDPVADYWEEIQESDETNNTAPQAATTEVLAPEAPVITTQPASQTIDNGGTATLSVSATGNPAPAYQWYRGASGVTTNPVGTNSASFTTPALTATTSYWVRVSNSQGGVNSQAATVTVNPVFPDLTVEVSGPATATAGTNFTYLVTARNNGNAATNNLRLNFTVPAGLTLGPPGIPTFYTGDTVGRTFRCTGGSLAVGGSVQFEVVASGPAATYVLSPGAAVVDPDSLVTESNESNNQSGQTISTVVSVPLAAPQITSQSASQTIANGATATLSVTATGNPAPGYQWYRGNSGDTNNLISGATAAGYTTPALTQTTSYWVRVSNSQGSVNGTTITVQVEPPVLIPDILVESPTELASGASVGLGDRPVDAGPASRSFTVRNPGNGTLENLQLSLGGPHAGDFKIVPGTLGSSVPAGGQGTFSIAFAATGLGNRSATLSITSNDPDESPFTISLSGNGLTPLEIAQQAYLTGGHPGAVSVAVSGNTVAVGVPSDQSNATGINGNQNNNGAPNSGAVHVFVKNGGHWSREAYIKASNTGAGDWFGWSVSLSGDTLAVSAVFEDSSATGVNGSQADEGATDSGAAYIFTRSNGNWTQQAYLKSSATSTQAWFGHAIAVSGDRVVVGANRENSNRGAAYTYFRTAQGSWLWTGRLVASNGQSQDQFGHAVAISGNNLIVGARHEDGVAADSGAAYIFKDDAEGWYQQAYLKASNPGAGDLFGQSVSISGGTVVVGAEYEDSPATGVNGSQGEGATDAGAAYVFERSGALGPAWNQTAYLKAANTGGGDRFGCSVGISGDNIIVGARDEDGGSSGIGGANNNGVTNSGAAYSFMKIGSSWQPGSYLKATPPEAQMGLGAAVAANGNLLVAGAAVEGGPDGRNFGTYVFAVNPAHSPPVISGHPQGQITAAGASAQLSVQVSGVPAPSFQWYQGESGDTTNPVAGATTGSFTTPPLFARTSFWVRATNAAGSADSTAALVGPLSSNARLASLASADGTLTPAFHPDVTGYALLLPHRTTAIGFRAGPEDPAATLELSAGAFSTAMSPGVFTAPVSFGVGSSSASVEVSAEDGSTRTYTIQVTRAAAGDDPVYRYDFDSDGVYPNLAVINGSGQPLSSYFTVAGGFLQQRSAAGDKEVAFSFPDATHQGGGFSAAKATYVEARLNVLSTTVNTGLYFSIGDGATIYQVFFTSGGVYIGSKTADPQHFLPLDLSGFHTYRIESPPDSDLLYFYRDGQLLFATTGEASTVNGFDWGDADGASAASNHANADWDYIEFGQRSTYQPPSAETHLSALGISAGQLSPAFSPTIAGYQASVGTAVSSLVVTPSTVDAKAKVRINGSLVASGMPSAALPLAVGQNTIEILVTAENLTDTRTYTLTVDRAPPMLVATGAADGIGATGATFRGSIVPNGDANARFEYGTSPSFGIATPLQFVSGGNSLDLQATVSSLVPATTYFYRLIATNAAGTAAGQTQSFTTAPSPPLGITGNPVNRSGIGATLVGSFDAHGLAPTVRFQYGLTTVYSNSTEPQTLSASSGLKDILVPITGLTADATYHVRIVVSTSSGTAFGQDMTFKAAPGGNPGSGAPEAQPEVATGGVAAVTTSSAELLGTVNPRGGSTNVRFQYGLSASYGETSGNFVIGNLNENNAVSLPAAGLSAGTTYHYRLVAENSLGTTYGPDAVFSTRFLPPDVGTGGASAITTTSVRVTGTVRANGATATVGFKYGTDPGLLNLGEEATPNFANGYGVIPVQALLEDLRQGTTYYYRLEAQNTGGLSAPGPLGSFHVGILSGLDRRFPDAIAPPEHAGSLTLVLDPPAANGGWRFAGEPAWRASGSAATGLADGDRLVEYRPQPGYQQPASETLAISSSAGAQTLTRSYTAGAPTGSGSVRITLQPAALAGESDPALRSQWRFLGEPDTAWRDSGATVDGLIPGNHIVECKPVAGRSTPSPVAVAVAAGNTAANTFIYYLAPPPVGASPAALNFTAVSSMEDRPYAFVGQILGDAGAGSGFVVKPRVVATAGHVVFDDDKLEAATGLRWIFQRDAGVHESEPETPRGFYVMTGYAAQRAAEDTPGVSSVESQNLDAAAMYFSSDVSRHGYSGFLASDSAVNEFVISPLTKTLVGYPVDGVAPGAAGRMHATPLAAVSFAPSYKRTYTSTAIRSAGGGSGGPLCVRDSQGVWYPAAIFLGGSNQTVVRAIDSEVSDLFGFAEASANSAAGATGGSGVIGTPQALGTPGLGGVKVTIEPAGARFAGAAWRINSGDPWQTSGSQIAGLSPNTYTVTLSAVPGYLPPAAQPVPVNGGQLTVLSFTYEKIISAPVIDSPSLAIASRGQSFFYQIGADNDPETFNLFGSLPAGLSFDALTGRITGTLQEAGTFPVTIGAANSGGGDTRLLTIRSLPVVGPQAATLPWQQPFSYQLTGSESGPGSSWATGTLPQGLVLDPATGWISGTPAVAGVFAIPVTLTKNGASDGATLTLTITGSVPVFTLQPPAQRTVEYGTTATFAVAVSGSPAPAVRWFRGESGDTTFLVGSGPVFSTPPLTAPAKYWARASSISGSADSSAVEVLLSPSTNPDLASLVPSAGFLSPGFDRYQGSYTVSVSSSVPAIYFTARPLIPQTVMRLNGTVMTPGMPSQEIALPVGETTVTLVATAGDGVSQRTHTVKITRAEPPLPPAVVTGSASAVTHSTAILQGTANPNGSREVFFEYRSPTAPTVTTPRQTVSGSNSVPVQALIRDLLPATTYEFRIGAVTDNGTLLHGNYVSFVTAHEPPQVATGDPLGIDPDEATLTGAIDPRGFPLTSLRFEWGPGVEMANSVPLPLPETNDGNAVYEVSHHLTGLVEDTFYHYCLVATTTAGTGAGSIITFTAETTTSPEGADGLADAPPVVATEQATDLEMTSAKLQGTVNPKDGSTFAWFEYGTSTSYGQVSEAQQIGNGVVLANVTQELGDLLPATTYHYRIVARNAKDTSYGEDRTFTTVFNPPVVANGTVEGLTPSSVRVHGNVNARGAAADVWVEWGTDGVSFTQSTLIHQGRLTGGAETPVSADITGLDPGIRYYARVMAQRVNGSDKTYAEPAVSFLPGALMGLLQEFPPELAPDEHDGQLTVITRPDDAGGWRFQGETRWRLSGSAATGLATGDRIVEFQPVAGAIRPPDENVAILSGGAPATLERFYYLSAATAGGSIQVTLQPASLTGESVPVGNRAQWRLAGVANDPWRDSGTTAGGLEPGVYLIECKPVPGQQAPSLRSLTVAEEEAVPVAMTYFPATAPNLNPPVPLPFATISASPLMPYGYVGQVISNNGSFSGFAVKRRVVATAAQAVFDDTTESIVPDLQWLLQRDGGVHEPDPMVPRGVYIFDGYASRRGERLAGTFSAESRNTNVAAMYFSADAGKGGYSGFLASDAADNPYLHSALPKILTGYPAAGVSLANQGRMHATGVSNASFNHLTGFTWESAAIRGPAGMEGGPLSVRTTGDGAFYPAGIYVGGTTRGAVRAIDAQVIDLFSRAEVSANGGDNNTGGGITHSSFSSSPDDGYGSIEVHIKPAAAAASAKWSLVDLKSGAFDALSSGQNLGSRGKGTYYLRLTEVTGFAVPTQQTVKINSNQRTYIEFTYATLQEEWRVTHFGTMANSGPAADSADPDGDGQSNGDEYIAGTNPQERGSSLHIVSTQRVGDAFLLTVPTVAGRTYILRRTTDLAAGSWETVDTEGPVTQTGSRVMEDPAAPAGKCFYQVVVTH